MSLITRCPACATMFKVVPDQLRISDGWVRCGQCAEIFDATQQLITPATAPTPHHPPSPPSPPAYTAHDPGFASDVEQAGIHGGADAAGEAVTTTWTADTAHTDSDPAPDSDPAAEVADLGNATTGFSNTGQYVGELSTASAEQQPDPPTAAWAYADSPEEDLAPVALSPIAETRDDDKDAAVTALLSPAADTEAASTDHGIASDVPYAPHVRDEPIEPIASIEPIEPVEPQAAAEPARALDDLPLPAARTSFEAFALPPEPIEVPSVQPRASDTSLPSSLPSFMRQKKPGGSVWQRPVPRTALRVVAPLLCLVLTLQAVRHERDRIVALAPDTRPALEQLCQWTQCTLSPLRRIESIVIDGSSFGRVRDNLYRLGIGIRNTAALPVLLPAVELALTNPQAQTVVRRVIDASEFGTAPVSLAPGAEWNGTLLLRIESTPAVQDIAGYGLFAFYP